MGGSSFCKRLSWVSMSSLSTTLSVPSPLPGACNSTLFYYDPNHLLPSISLILDSPLIKEHVLSPLSRAAMQVCFLYFCRISEVLNAQVSDIIDPDRVVLHGAKRSNSYVIYLPGLSSQVASAYLDSPRVPLFPVSYIKLYRDALKAGINTRVHESSNSRILHCARYIFSRQSVGSIVGSELSGVLRHRSLKNYSSYLK